MKKLINSPERFVDEMLEGLLLAHPGMLKSASEDNRALVRADAPVAGHVGIVTGGGSGHLPVFLGYVGKGLCSGVAIGNVFSSPSATQSSRQRARRRAGPACSTCSVTTAGTS